ncbi:hypothetical protein SRB5_71000 [Streptomyces sp. RB5]|uniref:Uncharacterized protein n=1 Tax=Streptomyces smaragdinus TaxID=2585196 RepID=A0A7K0CTT8_9ACTN|nr:hypothetical protein [Streptomyces smaragdinus]MQY16897.1 hypothetical protein [Streptomyces smaragdinus]
MLRALRRTAAAAGLALAAAAAATLPAAADDPVAWENVSPKAPDSVLYDIETAGGETWAVGITYDDVMRPLALRWDGTAWDSPANAIPDQGRLNDVAVAGPGDAWAVGAQYTGTEGTGTQVLQHWDGSAWSRVDVPDQGGSVDSSLSAVTVDDDGAVWVAGQAQINSKGNMRSYVLRRDPSGKWTETSGADAVGWINTLSVTPDGSLYAAAFEHVFRYDGKRWTASTPVLTGARYESVRVRAADDVWAVGLQQDGKLWRRPLIMHFDGTAWTQVATPPETGQVFDIAFDGKGFPVAVGESVDPAVSKTGTYILTPDTTGAFTHTESIDAAGSLYGAMTDSLGRVVAAGVTSDAPEPLLPYAYVGVRGY